MTDLSPILGEDKDIFRFHVFKRHSMEISLSLTIVQLKEFIWASRSKEDEKIIDIYISSENALMVLRKNHDLKDIVKAVSEYMWRLIINLEQHKSPEEAQFVAEKYFHAHWPEMTEDFYRIFAGHYRLSVKFTKEDIEQAWKKAKKSYTAEVMAFYKKLTTRLPSKANKSLEESIPQENWEALRCNCFVEVLGKLRVDLKAFARGYLAKRGVVYFENRPTINLGTAVEVLRGMVTQQMFDQILNEIAIVWIGRRDSAVHIYHAFHKVQIVFDRARKFNDAVTLRTFLEPPYAKDVWVGMKSSSPVIPGRGRKRKTPTNGRTRQGDKKQKGARPLLYLFLLPFAGEMSLILTAVSLIIFGAWFIKAHGIRGPGLSIGKLLSPALSFLKTTILPIILSVTSLNYITPAQAIITDKESTQTQQAKIDINDFVAILRKARIDLNAVEALGGIFMRRGISDGTRAFVVRILVDIFQGKASKLLYGGVTIEIDAVAPSQEIKEAVWGQFMLFLNDRQNIRGFIALNILKLMLEMHKAQDLFLVYVSQQIDPTNKKIIFNNLDKDLQPLFNKVMKILEGIKSQEGEKKDGRSSPAKGGASSPIETNIRLEQKGARPFLYKKVTATFLLTIFFFFVPFLALLGIVFYSPSLFSSGIGFALVIVAGIGIIYVNKWSEFNRSMAFSSPASDGPYSWVRHPEYAFQILSGIGLLVIFPSVVLLLGFAYGVINFVANNIKREEEQLISRFGLIYEAYRHKVPMLIPILGPAKNWINNFVKINLILPQAGHFNEVIREHFGDHTKVSVLDVGARDNIFLKRLAALHWTFDRFKKFDAIDKAYNVRFNLLAKQSGYERISIENAAQNPNYQNQYDILIFNAPYNRLRLFNPFPFINDLLKKEGPAMVLVRFSKNDNFQFLSKVYEDGLKNLKPKFDVQYVALLRDFPSTYLTDKAPIMIARRGKSSSPAKKSKTSGRILRNLVLSLLIPIVAACVACSTVVTYTRQIIVESNIKLKSYTEHFVYAFKFKSWAAYSRYLDPFSNVTRMLSVHSARNEMIGRLIWTAEEYIPAQIKENIMIEDFKRRLLGHLKKYAFKENLINTALMPELEPLWGDIKAFMDKLARGGEGQQRLKKYYQDYLIRIARDIPYEQFPKEMDAPPSMTLELPKQTPISMKQKLDKHINGILTKDHWRKLVLLLTAGAVGTMLNLLDASIAQAAEAASPHLIGIRHATPPPIMFNDYFPLFVVFFFTDIIKKATRSAFIHIIIGLSHLFAKIIYYVYLMRVLAYFTTQKIIRAIYMNYLKAKVFANKKKQERSKNKNRVQLQSDEEDGYEMIFINAFRKLDKIKARSVFILDNRDDKERDLLARYYREMGYVVFTEKYLNNFIRILQTLARHGGLPYSIIIDVDFKGQRFAYDNMIRRIKFAGSVALKYRGKVNDVTLISKEFNKGYRRKSGIPLVFFVLPLMKLLGVKTQGKDVILRTVRNLELNKYRSTTFHSPLTVGLLALIMAGIPQIISVFNRLYENIDQLSTWFVPLMHAPPAVSFEQILAIVPLIIPIFYLIKKSPQLVKTRIHLINIHLPGESGLLNQPRRPGGSASSPVTPQTGTGKSLPPFDLPFDALDYHEEFKIKLARNSKEAIRNTLAMIKSRLDIIEVSRIHRNPIESGPYEEDRVALTFKLDVGKGRIVAMAIVHEDHIEKIVLGAYAEGDEAHDVNRHFITVRDDWQTLVKEGNAREIESKIIDDEQEFWAINREIFGKEILFTRDHLIRNLEGNIPRLYGLVQSVRGFMDLESLVNVVEAEMNRKTENEFPEQTIVHNLTNVIQFAEYYDNDIERAVEEMVGNRSDKEINVDTMKLPFQYWFRLKNKVVQLLREGKITNRQGTTLNANVIEKAHKIFVEQLKSNDLKEEFNKYLEERYERLFGDKPTIAETGQPVSKEEPMITLPIHDEEIKTPFVEADLREAQNAVEQPQEQIIIADVSEAIKETIEGTQTEREPEGESRDDLRIKFIESLQRIHESAKQLMVATGSIIILTVRALIKLLGALVKGIYYPFHKSGVYFMMTIARLLDADQIWKKLIGTGLMVLPGPIVSLTLLNFLIYSHAGIFFTMFEVVVPVFILTVMITFVLVVIVAGTSKKLQEPSKEKQAKTDRRRELDLKRRHFKRNSFIIGIAMTMSIIGAAVSFLFAPKEPLIVPLLTERLAQKPKLSLGQSILPGVKEKIYREHILKVLKQIRFNLEKSTKYFPSVKEDMILLLKAIVRDPDNRINFFRNSKLRVGFIQFNRSTQKLNISNTNFLRRVSKGWTYKTLENIFYMNSQINMIRNILRDVVNKALEKTDQRLMSAQTKTKLELLQEISQSIKVRIISNTKNRLIVHIDKNSKLITINSARLKRFKEKGLKATVIREFQLRLNVLAIRETLIAAANRVVEKLSGRDATISISHAEELVKVLKSFAKDKSKIRINFRGQLLWVLDIDRSARIMAVNAVAFNILPEKEIEANIVHAMSHFLRHQARRDEESAKIFKELKLNDPRFLQAMLDKDGGKDRRERFMDRIDNIIANEIEGYRNGFAYLGQGDLRPYYDDMIAGSSQRTFVSQYVNNKVLMLDHNGKFDERQVLDPVAFGPNYILKSHRRQIVRIAEIDTNKKMKTQANVKKWLFKRYKDKKKAGSSSKSPATERGGSAKHFGGSSPVISETRREKSAGALALLITTVAAIAYLMGVSPAEAAEVTGSIANGAWPHAPPQGGSILYFGVEIPFLIAIFLPKRLSAYLNLTLTKQKYRTLQRQRKLRKHSLRVNIISPKNDHERFIQKTLDLAERRPTRLPLFRVGSVVVDQSGEIVGQGVNQKGGRHGEQMAIINALEQNLRMKIRQKEKIENVRELRAAIRFLKLPSVESMKGSPLYRHQLIEMINMRLGYPLKDVTLYINVEPCQDCKDVISRLNIENIVYSLRFTNPKHKYTGHQLLHEDGMNVTAGVLADQALMQNRLFFLLQKKYLYLFYKILHEIHRHLYVFFAVFKHFKQYRTLRRTLDGYIERLNGEIYSRKEFSAAFVDGIIEELKLSSDRMPEFAASLFVSARKISLFTEALARALANKKIEVVTGGGPGGMESGNKGAYSYSSIGLEIKLIKEQGVNKYVHKDKIFSFKYLMPRRITFLLLTDAFNYDLGGTGTLQEFFMVTNAKDKGIIDIAAPNFVVGDRRYRLLRDLLKIDEESGFLSHSVDELVKFVSSRIDNIDLIVNEIVSYRAKRSSSTKFTIDENEIRKIRRISNQVKRRLRGVGPIVTIDGSPKGTVVQINGKMIDFGDNVRELATRLANRGISIIITNQTGVGKAVMEGWKERNKSNNLSRLIYLGKIDDSIDNGINPDVVLETLHQFIITTVITTYSDQGIVYYPGGTETKDLLFEALTLFDTNKIKEENRMPLILAVSRYWRLLDAQLRHLEKLGTVSKSTADLNIIKDSVDEIEAVILKQNEQRAKVRVASLLDDEKTQENPIQNFFSFLRRALKGRMTDDEVDHYYQLVQRMIVFKFIGGNLKWILAIYGAWLGKTTLAVDAGYVSDSLFGYIYGFVSGIVSYYLVTLISATARVPLLVWAHVRHFLDVLNKRVLIWNFTPDIGGYWAVPTHLISLLGVSLFMLRRVKKNVITAINKSSLASIQRRKYYNFTFDAAYLIIKFQMEELAQNSNGKEFKEKIKKKLDAIKRWVRIRILRDKTRKGFDYLRVRSAKKDIINKLLSGFPVIVINDKKFVEDIVEEVMSHQELKDKNPQLYHFDIDRMIEHIRQNGRHPAWPQVISSLIPGNHGIKETKDKKSSSSPVNSPSDDTLIRDLFSDVGTRSKLRSVVRLLDVKGIRTVGELRLKTDLMIFRLLHSFPQEGWLLIDDQRKVFKKFKETLVAREVLLNENPDFIEHWPELDTRMKNRFMAEDILTGSDLSKAWKSYWKTFSPQRRETIQKALNYGDLDRRVERELRRLFKERAGPFVAEWREYLRSYRESHVRAIVENRDLTPLARGLELLKYVEQVLETKKASPALLEHFVHGLLTNAIAIIWMARNEDPLIKARVEKNSI